MCVCSEREIVMRSVCVCCSECRSKREMVLCGEFLL